MQGPGTECGLHFRFESLLLSIEWVHSQSVSVSVPQDKFWGSAINRPGFFGGAPCDFQHSGGQKRLSWKIKYILGRSKIIGKVGCILDVYEDAH